MIRNEVLKYQNGDKEARHFFLLKWLFICFALAMVGFAIEYYLCISLIGYPLMAFSIIAINLLMLIGFKDFFSKEQSPQEKYKRAKQPWEQ